MLDATFRAEKLVVSPGLNGGKPGIGIPGRDAQQIGARSNQGTIAPEGVADEDRGDDRCAGSRRTRLTEVDEFVRSTAQWSCGQGKPAERNELEPARCNENAGQSRRGKNAQTSALPAGIRPMGKKTRAANCPARRTLGAGRTNGQTRGRERDPRGSLPRAVRLTAPKTAGG